MNRQEVYNIYIGLKDKETLLKEVSYEEFIEILSNICTGYNIGFSAKTMNGGYLNDMGEYILEESLELTLVGANEEQVMNIANTLKEKVNQESIIVTKTVCDTYIIK